MYWSNRSLWHLNVFVSIWHFWIQKVSFSCVGILNGMLQCCRSLDDLVPDMNGTPVRSLIITTWQSGSTFLGDVLNSHPANYYHYEPLLDYEIIRIRREPLATGAIKNLRNLLNCNYTDMGMPPSCYILWSTLLYRMGIAPSCYIMWSTLQYRHGDGTILLHNVKHSTIQTWGWHHLVT